MVSLIGRPRNTALNDALVRAAGELIVEHGFAGVTVGAIAARAKTTRPAFYRRFEGIPEIVLTVLLEHALFSSESFWPRVGPGSPR